MTDSAESSALESWQIITGDKEFRDVQEYLSRSGISSNGFNYNVVSVFGSQSTGKSTLLNKLFGTRFATMDTVSRQQTTKGIWISRAVESDILVMDVEGTDGRERGDDQDFERKSALFSIATSEVLVVNMWETQVGLYNGANMGLLKTVFEVNLQLFQTNQTRKERSLLLFVIRDHLGTTPLDNLAATIRKDLEKMWDSLLKPSGAETTSISDYFDFQFVGLPHKVLMQQAFDEATLSLRHRFVDRQAIDTIFKSEYHKRIPADGFSQYAKGIWEAIEANKDLDLPSQQELLAQFRCDEIAAAAMSAFDSRIESTEKLIQPGIVFDRLGAEMSLALSDALIVFDTDASRYHNAVYIKKRAELLSSMDARLFTLYKGQLASKRKQCLQEYESSIVLIMRGSKPYDFNSLTSTTTAELLKDFVAEAQSCRIEPMTWSHEDDVNLLSKDMAEITARLRLEETRRINDQLYKTLKANFEEIIPQEFNQLDLNLWDRILSSCIDKTLQETKDRFASRLKALSLPETEISHSLASLERRAWRLLRGRIGEETTESHLLLKLREHFEESFKFDAEGVPIVWKAGDNIDSKYRMARERTLNIIPIFNRIQRADGTVPDVPTPDPDSPDDDFSEATILRVLSPAKQTDVTTRFRKIADGVYIDAKRSTVSSVASIPLYFYGLLLVLGWNELMALLRNPLYFITIIFAALVAYSVYTLNLSGPVEQVARAMFGTMFDIVKEKLRAALEVSQETVPELMHSKASGSITSTSQEEIALDDLTREGKKYD